MLLLNVSCSSKFDVKDVFWPAGIQSIYGPDANSKSDPTSSVDGDRLRRVRYRHRVDNHDSSDEHYRRHSSDDSYDLSYAQPESDWPACFGSCFAGRCTLEQERPGCCYPDSHSFYVSDQQTAAAAVTASDVSEQRGPGRDLVCWRGGSDTPQIVQGQA
jgi:hypothetical protein